MNKYKIDYNEYNEYGTDYPYALYVKCKWRQKWKRICSLKTKDEGYELYLKLYGLPVYLGE